MKALFFLVLFIFFFDALDSQTLVPYKKGELFGYSTLEREIVINPIYQKASLFNSNGYAVVHLNSKAFIIDTLGRPVKVFIGAPDGMWQFDELKSAYKKEFFKASYGGLTAYISPEFNVLFRTKEKIIRVTPDYTHAVLRRYKGKSGYEFALIHSTGQLVLPFSPSQIKIHNMRGKSNQSLFSVSTNDKLEIYDNTGNRITDKTYDSVKFADSKGKKIFILVHNDTVDILSEKQEVLYENLSLLSYKNVEVYNEVQKSLKLDNNHMTQIFDNQESTDCFYRLNKYCICRWKNERGKQREIYRNGSSMLKANEKLSAYIDRDGIVLYKIKDKKGIRNDEGEEISPLFDSTRFAFYNRHKVVIYKDTLDNYFTTNGQLIEGGVFQNITRYTIQKPGSAKLAFHNFDGIPRTPYKYDKIEQLTPQKVYLAQVSNTYEVLDSNGRMLLNFECDEIQKFYNNDNFYKIEKDGKQGVLHNSGRLSLPMEYNSIQILDFNYDHSFIRTKKNEEPVKIFHWDGRQANLTQKEADNFFGFEYSDGFYQMGVIYQYDNYYTPEGILITTLYHPNRLEHINLNTRKTGLVLRNRDHYFNYKTGVSYIE